MNASGITVVGKAPPEPDELERVCERGFDFAELYLERSHLTDIEETVATVERSAVEVVSVHTPHVPIDDPEWLTRADRLAKRLDAYLVLHSNRIIHAHIPELEQLGFESEHGYENNPGNSVRHVQSLILDRGHDLVLDTAHLYMAEDDYLSKAEHLFTAFGDRIRVVHLCDSTLTTDGLGFEEGEMDIEAMSQLVKQQFEGMVVLETMPDVQAAARTRFETY